MADRRSFNFICCLLCVLVSTTNLGVDAADNPLRHGTCGIEEGEDGFCESGDENMYLENVDISDLKDTGTSLQNKEGVESFSEDSPVEKTSNSLFDSKHENMYRENVDITDLKDTGASLQTKDDVENSSGGSPAEIPSSEDDKSLSEVSDKQIDVINNSTNEWLGLQIPVVDGVRVGHVQDIEILPGMKRQMKTLSMRPLVFEIPDFLDEDECELIIALAENKKLSDNPKRTNNRGIYYEDPLNTFKQWDLNGDEYIDPQEVVLIPGKMDLKFTEHNATQMMKTLQMDKDNNGKIDLTEFKSIELDRIKEYVDGLLNESSLRRIPNSKVSWLWHDEDELLRYQPELLDGFHDRLQAVTKIPKEIIQESEPMQVMQFEENNYQYCQQDSEPKFEGVPCCLYGDMQECIICRYITVVYFLNDVDDGGEVVLPLANSKFENDIMKNSGNWTGFFTYEKTTGSENHFEVDIQFKMDGANRVLYGKGKDDSGEEFELIDSLLTEDIIRFRKKYLAQGNSDVSIKYAGRLKGNTQIEGKWWIPGKNKMHGRFFMRHKAYEKWMDGELSKCNSHEYCSKGNLVVKPERGKAIMWYNHVLNDDGTWIGGLDNRMYYGHCDVIKREKWIATNWLNIDGDGITELRAWKRGINLISETKKRENQNIIQRMQKDRKTNLPDTTQEEFKSDMESAQEWTFESRPKERHVLNAVVSLLEALKEEELRDISKKVHEKLEMLCVPLVLNQGGRISIVDGSKAE